MYKLDGLFKDSEFFEDFFGGYDEDCQGMSDAIWAHLIGLDEFSEEAKR